MKNDKLKNQYRVNEQIRVREVRIVGEDGSEVVPTRKALDMAHQKGVDLVEISPNAQPPVCRLSWPFNPFQGTGRSSATPLCKRS